MTKFTPVSVGFFKDGHVTRHPFARNSVLLPASHWIESKNPKILENSGLCMENTYSLADSLVIRRASRTGPTAFFITFGMKTQGSELLVLPWVTPLIF